MTLALPTLGALLLVASPAPAPPSATEPAASEPAGAEVSELELCWVRPRAVRGKLRRRFADAIEGALRDAAPAHVAATVRRARSIRRAPSSCDVVIDLTARRPLRAAKLELKIVRPEVDDPRFDVEDLDLREPSGVVLGVLADYVWERVAPPAPPPPAPPPPPEPFVDTTLEQLKAEEARAAAPPPPPPRVPFLALSASAGMLSRTLDSPLGAQDPALLPAVGVRLGLRLGRWLPDGHAVDLTVAYHRQLGTARRYGADIGLSADLVQAHAEYRFDPGGWWPSFGPLAGFELQRFELDDPDTLSTRHAAVRLGGAVVQPIVRSEALRLFASASGAARIEPGSEGVTSSVGYDVGGALTAQLDVGLVIGARARLRQARGRIQDDDYAERFVDVLGDVGWIF